MTFNPFEDRNSRDVRNSMGHAFISSIIEESFDPFERAKSENRKRFSGGIIPVYLEEYIERRSKLLGIVMEDILEDKRTSDFFTRVSVILWNRGLYFEFHEWVEEEWVKKKGDERKVYQALILAAIFYEHLSYGRALQAEKVGKRAVKILKDFKKSFPPWIDTDVLIEKFENPDSIPPVLKI